MAMTHRLILLPAAVALGLGCSLLGRPGPSTETVVAIVTDVSPDPEAFSLVELHPSQGELSALLAAQATRATELGRRPFVEFSADWCPPCVALANSLSDQRMIEAFRGTYIVRLDLDEWQGRLSDSGFRVPGVPMFFELGGDGRPTGKILTGAAWNEDIPENMAPPLGEFFRAATP
jgi:thiol:disulfide interchange protein